MSVERHLMVSQGDLADLDAAFAWMIQTYDREFVGATMVKMSVEQIMVSDGDGPWHYVWTAVVGGLMKENPDAQ